MTRDGKSFKDFHKLCDNIAPNLLLLKMIKLIFLEVTNVSREDANLKKRDINSFLFSVTNNKKYFPKNINPLSSIINNNKYLWICFINLS